MKGEGGGRKERGCEGMKKSEEKSGGGGIKAGGVERREKGQYHFCDLDACS